MVKKNEVETPAAAPPSNHASLSDLTLLFLRLGLTAFGGPAAHIAMMEDEVVRRRRWLSRDKFLDLLGASNLIPGPSSTELAIYIGYQQAGWMGLLLGGVCFVLPAAMMVAAIAWAYVRFGSLPATAAILYGIKPVVIAVILQALWNLGRAAVKTKFLAIIGLAAVTLNFLRVNELIVLFGTGLIVAAVKWTSSRPAAGRFRVFALYPAVPIATLLQTATAPGATEAAPVGLWPLFLFFLKIGSVLFGSGYVLLAFLRSDLVERWHWMTNSQLLDAVAVGQVTPGPVFTTATFIGYVLGGPPGAIVATIGIFLPSFILVAISGPLIPRIRRSPTAGAFLDGVTVASLALMVVVTFVLGRTALVDPLTIGLVVTSAILIIRFRVNSAWLVLGGAIVGWLLSGRV
jgi:chromate transporter